MVKKEVRSAPLGGTFCWCADIKGTNIRGERCFGGKTYFPEVIDVDVSLDAKCQDAQEIIGALITGSKCDVSIGDQRYNMDSLNIVRGGSCGR